MVKDGKNGVNMEQRTELRRLGSRERYRFSAEPVRMGTKTNSYTGDEEETILLKNVKYGNKTITNHLWFNYGSNFASALVQSQENEDGTFKPCVIEFSGRVASYEKGWRGKKAEEEGEARYDTDYKIERPTKVILKQV